VKRVGCLETRFLFEFSCSRPWNDVNFIILIGRHIEIAGFPEKLTPLRALEVRELGRIGHNRSKPIIERHMELRCNVASFEIENQRNGAGVSITRSEVHRTL
jgi:hypothetical protein